MVTVEEFAEYIGADESRVNDLTRALTVASLLIDQELLTAFREMPSAIRDQCVLDAGYDLFKRSENNSGQYDSTEPLRASNDPLRSIRTILNLYVVKGI